MRISPTVRVLGISAVVVSAIIASSYALGQATSPSKAPPSVRAAATNAPSPSAPAPAPSGVPDGGPAPVRQAAARQAAPVAAVPWALAKPVAGPGQPPMTAEKGGPFGARRSTGTQQVALTFDDGPDPTWTPATLDLLKRYHVKATFCLVGINAKAFPELVRRIVDEGHTLCNHSWTHDVGMGFRSRESIRADLERTNAAIRKAVPGAKVSYYRQPGGAWTSTIVAVAREVGMTSLHWAVDPQDWRKPGAGSISSTVTSATRRGSIVLLHDAGGDRRGTVTALRTILPNLTRRFQLMALPAGIDPPVQHGRDVMRLR